MSPHPKTELIYNGQTIAEKDERLSLTDMWKAGGSNPSQQPSNWLASAEATRFKEFLTEILNPRISGTELVITQKGGKSPGSWAHWQLAFAYAKYLNPAFHAWCNQVVRDHMEAMAGVGSSFDFHGQGELNLDADGIRLVRSEINRNATGIARNVDGIKGALLHYLSKTVMIGIAQVIDNITDLYQRCGKAFHTIDKEVKEVRAAVEQLNERLLPESGETPLIMTEWFACHRIYADLFGRTDIPRQGTLSATISRSLDSFVLKNHSNSHLNVIDVSGKAIRIWHIASVRPWFDQIGRQMIADHIARNTPRAPLLTLVKTDEVEA